MAEGMGFTGHVVRESGGEVFAAPANNQRKTTGGSLARFLGARWVAFETPLNAATKSNLCDLCDRFV